MFNRNFNFFLILFISLFQFSISRAETEEFKNGPYTLDELISLSKRFNFQNKQKALEAYQSQRNVQVQVGKILPYLNLHMVLEVANQDYSSPISHLIGFIYPSNWYDLFEAKELSASQVSSFKSLVANQITSIENYYYAVSQFSKLLALYKEEQNTINAVVARIEKAIEAGEMNNDGLLDIRLTKTELEKEVLDIQHSLRTMRLDLAKAVGIPSPYWDGFELASIDFPNDFELPRGSEEQLDRIITRNSFDLATWEYLIRASRENTESRKWRFFHPDTDAAGSLGFGRAADIDIGRSETFKLIEKKKEVKADITLALKKLLLSFKLYRDTDESLKSSVKLVEDDVKRNNLRLEAGQIGLGAYAEALAGQSKNRLKSLASKIYLQTKYLTSRNDLERLLLTASKFQGLERLIPQILPNDHARWINAVLENQEDEGYKIELFQIGQHKFEEGHLLFDQENVWATETFQDLEDGHWKILSSGKIELVFNFKGRPYIALGTLRRTDYLLADDMSFYLKVYVRGEYNKSLQQVGSIQLTD